MAFVHETIRLYEDRRALTPVRKFLQEKELVNLYRVEDVFKEVLIPSIPPLPVPLQGHLSDLCRDILFWGLRLVEGMRDRTRTDSIIRYVKVLPVPCRGGWNLLKDASFGAGWQKTSGADLVAYLEATGTPACLEALKGVLLPPSSGRWRGDGERHAQLLLRAGAFDGLRLALVAPDQWHSSIGATFRLPEVPPPTVSPSIWESLDKHASAAATAILRVS